MFGDGRRALSSSQDGTLRIWNLDSGRQIRVLTEEATADESIFSHLGEINDVALTPDEQRAVAATANSKIAIWDLIHGSQLAALRGHRHHVRSVAVTPDGTRVVSGSWDDTIRVWSLSGLLELATLQGHDAGIEAVALTPDGARVVSGDRDGAIKIWDITATDNSPRGPITIAELRTVGGHDGSVNRVVTTNDGRAISGGTDGTLRVRDLETGVVTRSLETDAAVRSLAVSPDGQHVLACGSSGTAMRDLTSGARLDTFGRSATAVAFAPAGRQFVSGSWSGELHLWQLGTTETTNTSSLADRRHISQIPVLSPVLVLGDRIAVSATRHHALATWDLDTGRPVHVIAGHTDAITALAAVPDGRVVSASKDGTLKVWDPNRGEQLAELTVGSGGISAVAAIPDQRVVSASDDGTLKVWDLNRAVQLAELTHGERWFAPSVTPDGTRAVTRDHTALKVWNLRDPALLKTLKPGPGTSQALAISPDGRSAVEGATNLWDLERGVISHRLIDRSRDRTDLVASYLKPFAPPGDQRLQDLVSAVRARPPTRP